MPDGIVHAPIFEAYKLFGERPICEGGIGLGLAFICWLVIEDVDC